MEESISTNNTGISPTSRYGKADVKKRKRKSDEVGI